MSKSFHIISLFYMAKFSETQRFATGQTIFTKSMKMDQAWNVWKHNGMGFNCDVKVKVSRLTSSSSSMVELTRFTSG